MNVFLSWSGQLSLNFANTLHEYIPLIIQNAKPFISSGDIRKGRRWAVEIGEQLQNTNYGIICLTKDNLKEPWLLFEAGALSKNIDDSNVCTLLFDGLTPNEIVGPLSQFQHTTFDKKDIYQLFADLNRRVRTNPLSEKLLGKSFDLSWPELEDKVLSMTRNKSSEDSPDLSIADEESIDTVLRITRHIASQVSLMNKQPLDIDFSIFSQYYDLNFLGNNFNHPVRVRVFPVINKSTYKLLEITHKGQSYTDYNIANHPSRGVSIEILFYQESDTFFTVTFTFHKGQTHLETNDSPKMTTEERTDLAFQPIWRD
ncbi:MAG: hypothetical protein Roseis2KO_10080 [Roseivirga sp.]